MRSKRTKWLKTGGPIFLAGILALGGCSFGAGEPIQEIDENEANDFEDGFIYIHREENEEDIYLEQLENAFSAQKEELHLFNIREHVADTAVRTSDYGLNMNYHAVAVYADGELVDQLKLDEANEENEDVIALLETFIDRNKSE